MQLLQLNFIGLYLLFSSVDVRAGENWSGWRGGRGDGLSEHRHVPVTWSRTENIAWKLPLAGIGRSSPVIWGDRIFLTEAREEDQSRRVLCVDMHTGKLHWDVSVHQAPPGQMHKHNTSASSTPVVDGERAYSVFIDADGMQVVALDNGGKIIWKVSPGTFFSNHGFAASPVPYGDGLIVNGHQDGTAFIVMLDRRTGREIWRYRPAVNLRSFSTPVLTQHDGQDLLIVTGATQTAGLDPHNGELLWYAEGPAEKFVSTPSVADGVVYSFGGSPEKKAMALRLGGHGDVLASHLVWRNERAMPYVSSPLLVNGLLHVVNDLGIYTCLDPATGEALLTKRAFGSTYSSPVAVQERLYIFEDTGRCTVIQANAKFEVLAENELGEEVYTTPAVAEGCLIVRAASSLFRIGTESP